MVVRVKSALITILQVRRSKPFQSVFVDSDNAWMAMSDYNSVADNNLTRSRNGNRIFDDGGHLSLLPNVIR